MTPRKKRGPISRAADALGAAGKEEPKILSGGTPHFWHFSFFGVFFILYMFAISWLGTSPPELISVASVLTERVDVAISDGAKAAFPIDGMRIATENPAINGQCVQGLLTPAAKTTVSYGRVGEGSLEIKIFSTQGLSEPSNGIIGTLLLANGDSLLLTRRAYLATTFDCPGLATTQLPIWGQVSIGVEFQPIAHGGEREPTMLLNGHLLVMARSVMDALLSNPHLSEKTRNFLGRFFAPKLYPVADLTLPVGSRLEEGKRQQVGEPSNWWGTAYVDRQRPALVVEVASDARQLAVYRPNTSDVDYIRISGFEQLFSDPNLVWVQIVLGSMLLLGQLAGFLASWIYNKAHRKPR